MADSERLGLHNLRPDRGSRSSAKRVGRGRGSGLGKTSGRGHKGQKSRSGDRKLPAWFEGGQMPLHRRTPKRGFKPLRRAEYRLANVSDLAGLEETEITPGVLEAHGVVRRGGGPVKILGRGELDRAVTVRAHAVSGAARRKIEEAGGRFELLGPTGDDTRE